MALGVSWRAEALRSLDFGSISGTYAALGTAFENSITMLYIVNTTDALLTFTYNTSEDKWVVPASTSLILDIGCNKSTHANIQSVPLGSIIYVKGSPSVGTVYLSAFYANG
jgi:hypothetical protein